MTCLSALRLPISAPGLSARSKQRRASRKGRNGFEIYCSILCALGVLCVREVRVFGISLRRSGLIPPWHNRAAQRAGGELEIFGVAGMRRVEGLEVGDEVLREVDLGVAK